MSSKCLSALMLAGLISGTPYALALTAPSLGNAASFAVLAGAAVRNSGATTITGNVGVSPGTTVSGSPTINLGDIRNDLAPSAQKDAAAAYDKLTLECKSLPNGDVPSGVYCVSSLSGTVTLTGNADAVWIFQADTLTTAPGTIVRVAGGGAERNVFWQVAQSASLGPQTTFIGNILAQGDITFGAEASLSGRALALGRTSVVSLDNNKISLCCEPITVTNPLNSAATVNVPFSEAFLQSGAFGNPTFTVGRGVLPLGLILAMNGTLSGTPLERGKFPIDVLVTDANGCKGVAARYDLTVSCQKIDVGNPANATGTAGAMFNEKFTQNHAIGKPIFSTSSTLPNGLHLQTDGTLSGGPLQTGLFPIIVNVADGNGCTGTSAEYLLNIVCQSIEISTKSTLVGTAGEPLNIVFAQKGAIGTPVFKLCGGSVSPHPPTLPADLPLAMNGVLSGMTKTTGTFPTMVCVSDDNLCTGIGGPFVIKIGCQTINITNPAVTTGMVGASFSQTFIATGILDTATFTEVGALPTGITLATNGTLSGTTTQSGFFPITVTATDKNGCSGTGIPYLLVITPPACPTITLSPATLPPAVAAVPYMQTITAAGTTTQIVSFVVISGSLPPPLMLMQTGPFTADITGTPAASADFDVVIAATDADGCQGAQAYRAASIPALPQWELTSLSLLLAAIGVMMRRRS